MHRIYRCRCERGILFEFREQSPRTAARKAAEGYFRRHVQTQFDYCTLFVLVSWIDDEGHYDCRSYNLEVKARPQVMKTQALEE